MADPVIIPVTNDPASEFEIELDAAVYNLTFHWNELDSSWYMDIDGKSNTVALHGIKLLGGLLLIEPFAVLELGDFMLIDNEEKQEPADFDNFGDRFQLYYFPIG